MNLQIETTNLCNARCKFCLRTKEPPVNPGVIDRALYSEIINQTKAFNIAHLAITGIGEPLLDPLLEERLKIGRKAFPKAPISVYTNGIILTKDRVLALVKAGLTELYVSINAGSPESHETIMGVKGKYEHVVEVIKQCLDIPDLRVFVPAITGPKWLESKEVGFLMDHWSPNVLFLHRAGNWAGKIYSLEYTPRYNECRWFKNDAYINLNGDVCLCCYDPYGNYKFGNVKRQSLEDIWWGEKRQGFLNTIKTKGRGYVKPCKNCSTI